MADRIFGDNNLVAYIFARMLKSQDPKAAIALCRASGAARSLLIVAERVAEERCTAINRARSNSAQRWRRVLGHLAPEPKIDLELKHMWCGAWVSSVMQLADGRVLSTSRDGSVSVWDSITGEQLFTLTGL